MQVNVLIGQSDCFQGHWHKVATGANDAPQYHATGYYMGHIGAENEYYTSNKKIQEAVTDNIHGEPRIGNETRSINFTNKIWKRIN